MANMSHESAKMVSPAPETQLLSLSEAVLIKLPRELRDIVYSFLLDPQTLRAAHNKIFPRTAAGTLANHPLPSLCWPHLFRSTGIIPETMRRELIVYFIEHNTRLEIHGRACLEMLLSRDLFETRLHLSSAALPALAIHLGPLEYRDSHGVEDEWNRSAPLLLHGVQKLAHNFKLEVHLQTSCPAPVEGVQIYTHMSQIKDVILYFDMVIPALNKIKQQVTAKVPRGKVVYKLDFRRMFHTALVAEIREDMVDWNPDKWVYYLRCQADLSEE